MILFDLQRIDICGNALNWLWDGFNINVISLGQTGSSKSLCLWGRYCFLLMFILLSYLYYHLFFLLFITIQCRSDDGQDAVFSQLLQALYSRIQSEGEDYEVGLSCWDILGNDCIDLLSENNTKSNSMTFVIYTYFCLVHIRCFSLFRFFFSLFFVLSLFPRSFRNHLFIIFSNRFWEEVRSAYVTQRTYGARKYARDRLTTPQSGKIEECKLDHSNRDRSTRSITKSSARRGAHRVTQCARRVGLVRTRRGPCGPWEGSEACPCFQSWRP